MAATVMHPDNVGVDLSTLPRLKTFGLVYHGRQDTLFVQPDEPREATSIDLNGEMWLRVDVRTREVVGLEIEDFEAVFLKKHPEVAQAWQDVKPWCHRRKRPEERIRSFLLILLNFLSAFVSSNPQQAQLVVAPAT